LELFWVILGYIVILTVCFWIGEHLRNCRIAKRKAEAAKPVQEEPEVELTPDSRQAAQILSRDLERLAEELAHQYGVEPSRIEAFFAACGTTNPPPQQTEIIDLEEQPPEG